MNKAVLNIMTVVAILALAGCTTTHPVYPSGAPIMSAADAKSMIQVEVKAIEIAPEAPIAVASLDQPGPDSYEQ